VSRPQSGMAFPAGSFHRCSAETIAVVDTSTHRTAVIEDRAEVIDCLESVLLAAARGIRLEDVGLSVPEEYRGDIDGALKTLRARGFLIGSEHAAKRILRACRDATETLEYVESVVYGTSRWRHPSSGGPIARAKPLRQSERGRSTPLDINNQSFEEIDPQQIVELLTLAYGTLESGGKPVPSAGALWPLTIFAWARREEGAGCELFWFDDQELTLCSLDRSESAEVISSWFLQPDYLLELLGSGTYLALIAADLSRAAAKYANRAVFFSAIEAGAVVQEISRRAPSFGMSVRTIGGFDPANPPRTSSDDLEFLVAVAISRDFDRCSDAH
jgi:hypothetical protein